MKAWTLASVADIHACSALGTAAAEDNHARMASVVVVESTMAVHIAMGPYFDAHKETEHMAS
jgi:hypothetical protein